jgi:hypothetical protein
MIQQLRDWQLAGLKHAQKLRIDPESVNEAIGVVRSVFGDKWLEQACARKIGSAFPFRAHAIGDLLVPPGTSQLLDLLELVTYIKGAAGSPAFGELVAGLKAQYGPTFLQMAFGFRLRRAGAEEMHFEPPVQRGLKGDIGFDFEGTGFVAECYIPRNKRVTEEAIWLLQKCLELRGETDQRPAVIAISIKLRKTPTSQERKQIVRVVRESCTTVDANATAGRRGEPVFVETEGAFISVAQTAAVGPGEYSLGRQHHQFPDTKGEQPFLFGRVGVGRKGPLGEPLPMETETRDSVAIWLSDEDRLVQSLDRDLDEPLAELGYKLERKLAQAKRSGETERVLIVSSWLTDQLHRASPDALRNLERVLFEKHSRVAAVLFVLHSRLRTEAGVKRPHYRIVPLLPQRETSFIKLLDRVRSMEREELVPPIF